MNRKTIEKINETKDWFLEKIKNIDKPLAKLTKTQIIAIRNEIVFHDRPYRHQKDNEEML